mgnify:CR=1 FL=1
METKFRDKTAHKQTKLRGASVSLAVALLLMAVVRLVGIEGGDLGLLPLIAGFTYDADELPGDVYKHHEGSSSSSPKGAGSWLGAIRKAHGTDWFVCSRSGCNEEATCGAHLTQSLLMEVASLLGFGGTPVVPLCSSCHGTGSIETDDAPCIYDLNTPLDLVPGKRKSVFGHFCVKCDNAILGPDADGEYWCDECQHIVDLDGECQTDGCSECEDDDDDGWW